MHFAFPKSMLHIRVGEVEHLPARQSMSPNPEHISRDSLHAIPPSSQHLSSVSTTAGVWDALTYLNSAGGRLSCPVRSLEKSILSSCLLESDAKGFADLRMGNDTPDPILSFSLLLMFNVAFSI